MNNKTKLSIILTLAVIAFIIIFQNTDPVNLKVLFWHFEASLIILLLLVFLIGIIIGYFIKIAVKQKKKMPNLGD